MDVLNILFLGNTRREMKRRQEETGFGLEKRRLESTCTRVSRLRFCLFQIRVGKGETGVDSKAGRVREGESEFD